MDIFSNIILGVHVAFSVENLLYCTLGVTLGTLIGVLPGVGPVVTISVLLPLTFGIPVEGALIMLAGIFYGSQYGGSTTSILLNTPGEAASVVTCIDGHKMAVDGRAGPALSIAAIGSFFAGCVGTLLIALFGPALTSVALQFGAEEYFSLILLALVLSAALVHGSMAKGLAMALIGILLGLIGTDVNSGIRRFTFGFGEWADGIDFTVLAIGLFAIAEIANVLVGPDGVSTKAQAIKRFFPNREEFRQSTMPILRGTTVGSIVGVLPGAGSAIASFMAYTVERKVSRTPERFGHGAIEGVASPEAANNAASQTSFIPTLTLGIPGSATMALFLGALMIQGIAPGPTVMTRHPDLFWGLIVSMWVGNLILVIINLPLVGLWASVLKVPYRWLFPSILVFCSMGIYSVGGSAFDIIVAGLFGVVGFGMMRLGFEPAPLILGFVLGPMLEENFRRALLLSRGDLTTFLTEPISGVLLLGALVTTIMLTVPQLRKTKEEATREG